MSYTCNECYNLEPLPFVCNDCKKYFCRKHLPLDKHKCLKINNSSSYRYISESQLREVHLCNFNNCNNDDNENSICKRCNKKFCKKHEYPWHKCIENKKKISFWEKIKSCFNNT